MDSDLNWSYAPGASWNSTQGLVSKHYRNFEPITTGSWIKVYTELDSWKIDWIFGKTVKFLENNNNQQKNLKLLQNGARRLIENMSFRMFWVQKKSAEQLKNVIRIVQKLHPYREQHFFQDQFWRSFDHRYV